MNNKYDAVLFDFDGTIADTGKGIFNGVYHVLASMGIDPPEPEKLRFFIGPPLYESFRVIFGFDEETCAAAVLKYREYYSAKGIFELTLYDGMEDLFCKLKAKNIKTGIASSKPEVFLLRIAESLGLSGLVDTVKGSDIDYTNSDKSAIIRRAMEAMSLPAGAKVLMVGDRCFDIIGAKKAGVDSAGVLFGYGSRKEFEEAGADYIIEKPMDIFEIVIKK